MKAFGILAFALLATGCFAGPLYDYVHTPDSHYSFFDTGIRLNNDTADAQWTGYLINMTSQAWLDEAKVDRVIWTHQLVIIVPKVIKHLDTAGLYITGGDNNHPGVPSATGEDILLSAIMAQELNIVTATLFQIPNAPVVFTSDPTHEGRGEDALVAYSWKMFLGDQKLPEWNVYFAMIKACVRALDTIEAMAPKLAPSVKITKHFVHGASKRGWSTWLTAAVGGDRIIGMGPIVMDLGSLKNIQHMYQAYGGWTFAFKDYWANNITRDLPTPLIDDIGAIQDIVMYKENLTLPKLIIDSTGDEFFMPDDDWYWWGQFPGETYRLMVANAEHSFATGILSLVPGLNAFYESILLDSPRPDFTWDIDFNNTGTITITSHTKPEKVILRFATTTDDVRRDFRLIKGDTPADPCHFIPVKIFGTACLNPCFWEGEDLAPTSVKDGVYTYVLTQPMPPSGWRAFLGELHFPAPNGKTFIMTTQVSIIPNTFPFPKCTTPEQCAGVLV